MDHPSVVTLENRSAPRTLFAGDKLIEVELPAGTRCIYPKPPLEPLVDVEAAIENTLNVPDGESALYAQLYAGMKLTLVVSDNAAPLSSWRRPDIRGRILERVLRMASQQRVTDVEIIVATGIRRRLRADEIRNIVGEKVFASFYPAKLYNHDAEDDPTLLEIGVTALGNRVRVNRRAAESDLVVSVSLSLGLSGGANSIATGLSCYSSLQSQMRRVEVEVSAQPSRDWKKPGTDGGVAALSELVHKELKVFSIEATVNNQVVPRSLEFLSKNEDELTVREKGLLKGMVRAGSRLPSPLRKSLLDKLPAPLGVTGVFAGTASRTGHKAAERNRDQYRVPVEGQADVLICPIPYLGSFSASAFLNPLLVQALAESYLLNVCGARPLVKRGGTLILTHPMTDHFDAEQHVPYVEFVHRVLPESPDARAMRAKHEPRFASDPALLQMFRSGHAYHPTHPFLLWYGGEEARAYIGRVIVVGADNEYIPSLFGYETAPSMSEALYRAKNGELCSLSVTCLKLPPLVMADVGGSS